MGISQINFGDRIFPGSLRLFPNAPVQNRVNLGVTGYARVSPGVPRWLGARVTKIDVSHISKIDV